MSLQVDVDGIIKSQVFPGLWLSMSDLLAGNMQQVLAVLQLGLNSPEHQRLCGNCLENKDSKINS